MQRRVNGNRATVFSVWYSYGLEGPSSRQDNIFIFSTSWRPALGAHLSSESSQVVVCLATGPYPLPNFWKETVQEKF
jgi:hypothetical protein